MDTKKEGWLPLYHLGTVPMLAGSFLLELPPIMLAAALSEWSSLTLSDKLLLLLLPAAMALGVYLFCRGRFWLHLTPDRVALYRHGRKQWEMPGEAIHFFWKSAPIPEGSGQFYSFGISFLKPETLTQRREAQLQKGRFSRDELKFRKRAPGWEMLFQREYLRRNQNRFPSAQRQPELLALGGNGNSWILRRLMALYPQVPLLDYREKYADYQYPQDRRPDRFCRGCQNKSESTLAVCAFAFLMLPLAAILLFIDGGPHWPVVPACAAILLGIYLLFRAEEAGELEELEPRPEGIRIYRKNKPAVLFPAHQIRTVAFAVIQEGHNFTSRQLVISPQSVEALARAERERTQKFPFFRRLPAGKPLLAETEDLALRRLRWQCTFGTYRSKKIFFLHYAPERLETLRKMYPQAEFIGLEPDILQEKTNY